MFPIWNFVNKHAYYEESLQFRTGMERKWKLEKALQITVNLFACCPLVFGTVVGHWGLQRSMIHSLRSELGLSGVASNIFLTLSLLIFSTSQGIFVLAKSLKMVPPSWQRHAEGTSQNKEVGLTLLLSSILERILSPILFPQLAVATIWRQLLSKISFSYNISRISIRMFKMWFEGLKKKAQTKQ